MKRNFFLVFIQLSMISGLCSAIHTQSDTFFPVQGGDTLKGSQFNYNGRIWRDLYVSIREDQFLFSNEFLPGTVTMNGKTFNTPKLRYDILNDEIMIVTDKGQILQLNKEMVEKFTLKYRFRNYDFTNSESDSLSKVPSYLNILYEGRSSLFIRYYKEISKSGPGKNYEDFVQSNRVYIVKDGFFHQVRNNRDFKKFVSDKKDEIKAYLKENRIMISRKSPDTYVPVLEYYDTLK
ncbi:MAG: hypothetical protein A2X04_11225 [Bacteroidetes bacterium GWF2_41_9]|nr:MAG: hypothetical protein A2X06_17450 [Bacteroidetes bacterium GWC2_40_22]OFY56931.1 MAG: hypothetical protein A2X04_11225 [Bacteroidetes bacterium GWF2_41_9]HAM09515.1 hypothetical protein [Bacteroidales bacterium]HBH83879.1 hypothetical protein [Bacteroidales bacterium]